MRTLIRFMVAAVLVTSLSGCGIIDYFYLPVPEETAQELFEAGNDSMRDKDYSAASYYYTKLKDTYPFSPYTIEAELSLADAYFLDEEWVAAIDAYKEFESLHPRHEAMPYVLFNIAMAGRHTYLSIDRPITPVEDSYSYFKRISEAYPDSEYADQAREKMVECRRLMAEHELYIADFYYRAGRYGSAWARYKNLVEQFKDVPDIAAHAEEKGQAAFIQHREHQSEAIKNRREGSWKGWFDWL